MYLKFQNSSSRMRYKPFNWLTNLISLGVNIESENDISRRISFSNIVFMTLPVVYLIFMVVDFQTYLQPIQNLRFDQFIVPIVIGVCGFCLWMNKIGQTTFSRILFLASWPVLLHLIPISLLNSPPDYYFAFPIGIIFHAVLIQLMLSQSDEPFLFWFFISFNFLILFFSLDILLFFGSDQNIPTKLATDPYYLLDCILYWLLFNLIVFYMILAIGNYIVKINTSHALIEEQKEELNALNINLENIVIHRTQKLEEQNKKLLDHAFYNAHLLRGPFCRIKGLIQLQALISDEVEKKDILNKLQYSIEELEIRIQEIQQIVDSESFDK